MMFHSFQFMKKKMLLAVLTFNLSSIALRYPLINPFLRYTEPLFAALTFSGMNAFENRKRWKAALFWFGASAVRSNGVLMILFFMWTFLFRVCASLNIWFEIRNEALVLRFPLIIYSV
jgi:Gpi18-like mannosyltransferase